MPPDMRREQAMFASHVRLWAFLLLASCASPSLGDGPAAGSPGTLLDGDLSDFARRAFQITELVLDKHVEPPTRQEMLLCGLIAVHGNHAPAGLSRAVSEVRSIDEFVQCLLRFWPKTSSDVENASRRLAFLRGLGLAAPGGINIQPAKEAAVQRQLTANQYVGVGITLQPAASANVYQIAMTFPRGPAAKAGLKAGEFLTDIDGIKTENLTLGQLIDRLRGPEGTTVTIGVATDADSESRAVTLTRSVVPRQTVVGCRQLEQEKWEAVLGGEVPVGYLSITEIGGSTVAELRDYEAELLAKRVDSLILDLRRAHGGELRHAIAIADALLDGGSAAGVRVRGGYKSAPLDRDCLFRDWPMAVLVAADTHQFAEWLAGLLQQRRGAIVVGQPTAGANRLVLSSVELPHDWGVMKLATAILEHDNPPSEARGSWLISAFRSAELAERRMIAAQLFRLPADVRVELDRLYAVTPDVHVESSLEESFAIESPQQPDLAQSPFVAIAITALAKPSRKPLRRTDAETKDKQ